MTSVAANIVASGTGISAVAGASTNTSGDDNGFAAMLGGVMLGNDKATVAKPDDDNSDSTKAVAVQASLPAQSLHPLQEDTAPCQATASLASSDDPDMVEATDDTAALRNGIKSDPAQIPSGAPDPNLVQLLALQQPVPASAAAAADAAADASARPPAGIQADPVQLAIASAASTDVAAAAILTGGVTTKAAKPGDGKATSDSEKSQSQGSTAAALADTAASRVFTDQRVSTAHALPLHIAADQGKSNGQSGGSPQQNTGGHDTTPSPAPVTAAAAETPVAAAAPAPAQAAPQPDAVPAANAAGPSMPVAPAASTSAVAAQLQISHPAPASLQPDINSLAFNIAAKSEGGARHFDIRLDPAELGRVDVRLTVDDAGKAQATLSVEKPQTLALLQNDQSHLERALKEAGLDLSQNGLNFSLKGQQQQGGSDHAPSSRGRNLTARVIAAVEASTVSMGSASPGDARLDIRV